MDNKLNNTSQKKRVGIMTLYFNYNYGALLQAYALHKIIQERGYDVENIRYYREINGKSTYLIPNKSMREKITEAILNPKKIIEYIQIYNQKSKAKRQIISLDIMERKSYFDQFIKDEIKESKISYDGHKEIIKSIENYDIFVCGSDNIWNKNMFDTAFMLDFVPNNKLKIAYAPGMSANSLSKKQINLIKEPLSRIDHISCREKMGADLIKEILHKNIFVALDPTLLRSAEEWQMIEKKPKCNFDLSQDYIFCYFCGNNVNHRKSVQSISKSKNIPIITLPNISGNYEIADADFGDCQIYSAGPREFIYLIRNAKYIFTDSFHGSIFSIIFQKNFLSYYRFSDEKSKFLNKRIDNLYTIMGISKKRIITDEKVNILEVLDTPLDYSEILLNLEKNKNLSLQFLDTALSNEKKGNQK